MNMEVKRNFLPGDEWMYYKVYLGAESSDHFLTEKLFSLIEYLQNEKIIKSWFFARFFDPEYHLRIRFKLVDTSNIGELIKLFNENFKYLLDEKYIWKVQLDTYKRELERYGATRIQLVEEYFHQDSRLMLMFLSHIVDNSMNDKHRWLFGLKCIDSFLTSFGFSLEDKLQISENFKQMFYSEFKVDKFQMVAIGNKYRLESEVVEQYFDPKDGFELYDSYIESLLDGKRATDLAFFEKLSNQGDQFNSDEFIFSILHMGINRLFKSRNREYELVLYEFLNRFYQTQIKRKPKN